MDGVLIIDKSTGPTSHDVVASVRKTLGIRKVGHAGTLDPAATGVLPLMLGKATKLARYLSGTTKTYHATIRLGVTTDTLDAEGTVTGESPVEVTEEEVRAAAARFVGEIQQVPPMYSAKKIDGKRLYELARKGVEVEREAKTVVIQRLDVIEFNTPDIVVELDCSAGTYVRVIAEDLGNALGCGAYLLNLRRTAVGGFGLDEAITLEELVDEPQKARSVIRNLTGALTQLPRIDVPSDIARMVCNGYQLTVADLRSLDVPTFDADTALVLRVDGGDVIAVVRALLPSADLGCSRRDKQALKTERVLR